MAQINITLNQEEIQRLLTENRDEAFKKLLENAVNSVLKAESTQQLHAEPYERTEERTDSRNGFRDRPFTTRIGRITLHVPRHRKVPFKTMIFDNYSRSEAALIAGMAEMVVNGVSTRRVSKVVETLCGTSFSKSTVSELCKDLSKSVEAFRNRPLEGKYIFLSVDATYFKVREDHRIISKAFMVALATNEKGVREIIGFGVYNCESKETWKEFLMGLKNRGLNGVLMITSDAHEGLRDAVRRVFPNVPWQRCQFHFSRNVSDKAPKKYQAGIRADLNELFNCRTLEEARKVRDRMLEEYSDVAPSAMECLESGFDDAMTVMALPRHLRKYYRTSNHLERLNKELKRRSDVIGIFPTESSLLRLMGSVLIEKNEGLQEMKAVFSAETLAVLLKSETPQQLMNIADGQAKLLTT